MTEASKTGFPSQKKTKSQKTKKWAKQCVDNADKNTAYRDTGVRKRRRDKLINLNLYNGILNRSDMEATLNPYNMTANFIPDEIPHYPIASPKIDLLVGEEYNRRFDYKVVVTNPDAVSKKETEKKNMWLEKLQEVLLEDIPEDQMDGEIQKFSKYMKYEWQDIRELMATNILKHYSEEQEFKYKFNQGFKNAMLMGEEIYQLDIVSNEPKLHLLNPLSVHTVRSGNSNKVEDSDLIIIDEFWSPGRVIDQYYDKLKPADIKNIEGGFISSSSDSGHEGLIHQEPELWVKTDDVDDYLNLAESSGHSFNNHQDANGNVRVLRVYWRSLRRIQKVKYYDEDGNTQFDFFPEDYKIDENRGEESTFMWVNEWWEGTKIGKDIYVNMRPRPVQYNSIDNPSVCHPGIIGIIYNTNERKSVCPMDRMKQYQYLYDSVKDRLNKAMSKYLGPLMELDLAKVPGKWDMDKWLYYAYSSGIAVTDSFKEGNKGASTGKLAGSFNTSGKPMNLDMGNYIQQHIQMLEYIKAEMGEIIGINKQREGQVSNRETVGGVERAVNQSSHITEHWFATHELVKARVLNAFLETAKIALKNQSKKVQYILGDDTIAALELDGSEFCESSYGILVSLNNKYKELDAAMRELAHAGIQNDKMDYSTLMSIYTSESLSDIRRKIETKEEEKLQADSQRFQAEQEQLEKKMVLEAEAQNEKEQGEEARNIRDNETKLLMKSMEIEAQMIASNNEENNDGIKETNPFDIQKHKDDLMVKMKALNDDMQKHKDKMKREDAKIAVSRSNKKATNN